MNGKFFVFFASVFVLSQVESLLPSSPFILMYLRYTENRACDYETCCSTANTLVAENAQNLTGIHGQHLLKSISSHVPVSAEELNEAASEAGISDPKVSVLSICLATCDPDVFYGICDFSKF